MTTPPGQPPAPPGDGGPARPTASGYRGPSPVAAPPRPTTASAQERLAAAAPSLRPGRSRGGLSRSAAVALLAVAGLVGMLLDLLTGTGLRVVFAVALVAAAGLAGLAVRRRWGLDVVVAVPLVYAVCTLLAAWLQPSQSGPSVHEKLAAAGSYLISDFPVLVVALAAAVVGVGVGRTARRGR